MADPDHVQTMAAYGAWMNARTLDLCGGLSDGARRRALGRRMIE